MAYESRQDKEPGPQFFADLTAILKLAFPGVEITQALMEELKPVFVAAWRRGYPARKAATLACRRCEGGIEPSPAFAAEAKLPKGAVRAPKGAKRGETFGADALRPPRQVERLLREIEIQRDVIAREQGRKAPDKGKVAELEKTLIGLQERLDAEWPQPERIAPMPAPRPKKPKKERPKKEPKPRKVKEPKEPKPKKVRAVKEPKKVKEPAEAKPKAKKPKAQRPSAWTLADHTLRWVKQENRYVDLNHDLLAVVLLNDRDGAGVSSGQWNKKRARVEFYEGDKAHAEHLAAALRAQGAEVEMKPRPAKKQTAKQGESDAVAKAEKAVAKAKAKFQKVQMDIAEGKPGVGPTSMKKAAKELMEAQRELARAQGKPWALEEEDPRPAPASAPPEPAAAGPQLACNAEAPSGGNQGPRRCYRPPGHEGKHQYREVGPNERIYLDAAAPAPKEAPVKPPKAKRAKTSPAPAPATAPPGELTDKQKDAALLSGFKDLAGQIAAQLRGSKA